MIAKLKPIIEKKYVEPLARHIKIRPSVITLFSMIVMIPAVYFILNKNPYLCALFVAISGFLDILDGTVAKVHNKVTKFGGFFDRTADRINDIAILSSIIIADYVPLYIGVITIAFTIIPSYVSACLEAKLKTRIGEKFSFRAIRIIILIIGLLTGFVYYSILAILAIGVFAFFERFFTAFRILRKNRKEKMEIFFK